MCNLSPSSFPDWFNMIQVSHIRPTWSSGQLCAFLCSPHISHFCIPIKNIVLQNSLVSFPLLSEYFSLLYPHQEYSTAELSCQLSFALPIFLITLSLLLVLQNCDGMLYRSEEYLSHKQAVFVSAAKSSVLHVSGKTFENDIQPIY